MIGEMLVVDEEEAGKLERVELIGEIQVVHEEEVGKLERVD